MRTSRSMLRTWSIAPLIGACWVGACGGDGGGNDSASAAGAGAPPSQGGAESTLTAGEGGAESTISAGDGGGAGHPAVEGAEGGAGGSGAGAAGEMSDFAPTCHDGGPGDGATCASFCSGWFPICKMHPVTAELYADVADCLADCRRFSQEQLCCRGYHITNAPKNPNTHCSHSAGIRTCP